MNHQPSNNEIDVKELGTQLLNYDMFNVLDYIDPLQTKKTLD